MKIVIINKHPFDTLGGSEIQCDIFANELTKLGQEVIYLAINGKKEPYRTAYTVIAVEKTPESIATEVIKENPDIVYWRFNRNIFYKSVKKIKKVNLKIVFAISHINDITKLKKIPSLPRDLKSAKTYIKNFKNNLIAYWNYKGFRYIDGITSLNKEYLQLSEISNKEYIPNSMTSEVIDFEWDRPFVFWVANLKPQKRPEVCEEVSLALQNLGVDLLMVGQIQNPNYEYYQDKENLPKNLFYLGPKTVLEVNGILQKSICLIHTCEPEGFGNNFIQAWLQGKPTVSLEFDPGELIQSKELGFVSGNNVFKFISDIKKVICDVELRNKFSSNAKQYAESNHLPSTNTKKLLAFLNQTLNDK